MTITITGKNDAPVVTIAIADQVSSDGSTITAVDITGNFDDPDTSDKLTFSVTGLPTGLSLNPTTGEITGTIDNSASQGGPANDGNYSVTITATDNNGASIDQSFIWTVNNPDVIATDNTASVTEAASPSDSGNLITDDDGNGIDVDGDDDPLIISAIAHNGNTATDASQPIDGAYGTLTWQPDGTYSYTLNNDDPSVQALRDNETLTDVFTYTVTDGQGSSDTAQLIVTIAGLSNPGWNGSPGDDIVTGVDPSGGLSGLSDPDTFYGFAGNDIINGGSDVDFIDGGDDNDIISGGSGPDMLLGQAGRDVMNGGSGPDFVDGGSDRDVLMGSGGDDVLVGGTGNDILNGGRDQDLLQGGAGADTLIGGQGDDRFQYKDFVDSGDTIVDFEIVRDRIDLSEFAPGPLGMANLTFTQVDRHTNITLSAAGQSAILVTLLDVNAWSLTERHFDF